jgi:hypothetical protein
MSSEGIFYIALNFEHVIEIVAFVKRRFVR